VPPSPPWSIPSFLQTPVITGDFTGPPESELLGITELCQNEGMLQISTSKREAEWPAAAQRRQRSCSPRTPFLRGCSASPEPVLALPGMPARHPWNHCSACPERLLTLLRNRCSAWPGTGARHAPEHAFSCRAFGRWATTDGRNNPIAILRRSIPGGSEGYPDNFQRGNLGETVDVSNPGFV